MILQVAREYVGKRRAHVGNIIVLHARLCMRRAWHVPTVRIKDAEGLTAVAAGCQERRSVGKVVDGAEADAVLTGFTRVRLLGSLAEALYAGHVALRERTVVIHAQCRT